MHPEEAAALLGELEDTELHRAAPSPIGGWIGMDQVTGYHQLPGLVNVN
jgi:hypothetical protein